MDYVNVLKQISLALHYVLVQEVVTKNRITFKSISFMIHSIKKLSLSNNIVKDVILLPTLQ